MIYSSAILAYRCICSAHVIVTLALPHNPPPARGQDPTTRPLLTDIDSPTATQASAQCDRQRDNVTNFPILNI